MPNLQELDYEIYQGVTTYPAHAPFTVDTKPINHNLCGALNVTPNYEGGALDPVNGPLTNYDPITRVFTADSIDEALVGTVKDYGLTAEFVEYPKSTYPSVSQSSANSKLNFGSSCNVATLLATSQINITPSNAYDGQPMVFTLSPFQVDPPICLVTYECISIVGAEASPVTPTCSSFSGNLNDVSRQLTTSFNKSDYANVRPQVYTVTIRGTATKSGATADATFTFELEDFCLTQATVNRADIPDTSYNIANTSRPTYSHNAFTTSIPECQSVLTYSYTTAGIVNSAFNTVIENYDTSSRTFTFFYPGNDDGPVRPTPQTEQVTVTAVVGTIWGTGTGA